MFSCWIKLQNKNRKLLFLDTFILLCSNKNNPGRYTPGTMLHSFCWVGYSSAAESGSYYAEIIIFTSQNIIPDLGFADAEKVNLHLFSVIKGIWVFCLLSDEFMWYLIISCFVYLMQLLNYCLWKQMSRHLSLWKVCLRDPRILLHRQPEQNMNFNSRKMERSSSIRLATKQWKIKWNINKHLHFVFSLVNTILRLESLIRFFSFMFFSIHFTCSLWGMRTLWDEHLLESPLRYSCWVCCMRKLYNHKKSSMKTARKNY